ncbi:hypothetical protein ACWD26_01305 [Streptomyces sp. NPDC002787]
MDTHAMGTHNTYDHIVVGTGSAGCVIVRRLVDAGRSVLLIEAGGTDDHPPIHDSGRMWELWKSPVDYAYLAEPREHAGGAQVFWPRGRAVLRPGRGAAAPRRRPRGRRARPAGGGGARTSASSA